MNLYGDKVMLRPIQKEDFDRIVYWSNLPEIGRFSEGDYPADLGQCDSWYKRLKSNRYQKRFAIILDNSIIGDIELDHIAWRSGDAELRIRIGEIDLWDHGYGTDAICTLLQHAFHTLDLSRIYLKVYTDNYRAISCYHKAGFTKEGKLSRGYNDSSFREIFLMKILKQEFERKHNLINKVG